ncbi:hypothetical protein [Chitinophaga sp. 212800010-3]|uniref:hypothetical protein n=1 Tax=unclassified Chitinophaga TaxID=2619133 RepID=UPI002DEFEE38|nr:Tryptophan-rich sensory protein [Chitinophaga sp. 212800010-3]
MVLHETLHFKNRAIFNTLGYILMIAVNALATLLPINGQTPAQVSEDYPNLFAPAGFTYAIWGVIYAGLLVFVIYQLWLAFSGRQPEILYRLMHKMKDWFLISSVANACWLFAWHYHLIPVSVVIMLILLSSLLIIHINLGIGVLPVSTAERLLVHFPFSMYLGWITVATLANISALMVYAGLEGNRHSQVIWTDILIGAGTLLCMGMILLRNNIVYALVTVWALYGILLKRKHADMLEENSIIHTCIIAIGLIAVTISWQLYRKQKS